MRRIVAKRAARKVAPQIEVFELETSARLVVAGQQREIDVVTRRERIEELADPGHEAFARHARLVQFDGEVANVGVSKAREAGRIGRDAVRSRRVVENPRVGAAGHGHALEGIRDCEDLLEGERHRSASGAAGEHKRTVDVEKDECGGVRLSLRRERCRRAALWPTVLRRS